MNVLVAVASRHGSIHQITEANAEVLRRQGLAVDLAQASDVHSLNGYGAVVIGNAWYAGSWLAEARTFVERFHEALSTRPVWLISSGQIGADQPKPPGEPAGVAPIAEDIHPRDHHLFTGTLLPAHLSLGERVLAMLVHAEMSDYRNWGEIRGRADTIAGQLAAV